MDDEVIEEEKLPRVVRVILWACFILFILTLVSIIRSYYVEDSIDQLDQSVDQLDINTIELTTQTNLAKDAAVEARDSLNDAIAEAKKNNSGSSGEAISNALASIARIERYLCGGPCEETQP